MQYLSVQHVMKKTVSTTQSGLILVSLLLLMIFTVSGCGQKGDLYVQNPSQKTPTSNTGKDKFLIDEQTEKLVTQPAGSAKEGLQVPESQNY